MRARVLVPCAMAVAVALGAAFPAPTLAEGATCVGAEFCNGTYLSVTSLGPSNSSSGAAVAGVGHASGVVAIAVFGNATAHSFTVVVGGVPVTVPGIAVTATGHARGDYMVSGTGTTG